MRIQSISILAASAAFLFSGCAVTRESTDPNAPTGAPDATLTVDEVQAGFHASAATGRGTINFRGRKHDFTISSLGAGGTGVQEISADGKVYNLTSLADFPGTYTGVSSGHTIIGGVVHEKLTNSKGTVIYLTGLTRGVASSTGIDKLLITME